VLLQLDDEEKRYANADDAQSVEQSDRLGVEHRLHERRVGEGELHGHHQRHADQHRRRAEWNWRKKRMISLSRFASVSRFGP